MKISKKQVRWFIIGFTLVGLLICTPRAIPKLFYSYKQEYKNYTVYANSPIHHTISKTLDSSIILTNNSFLNAKAGKYQVFLVNNKWLIRLHTGRSNFWAASDFFTNYIYITQTNVAANTGTLFAANHTRSLHSLIAHEQTHIMMRKKLGFWRYLSNYIDQPWRIEGICEYISLKGKPFNIQKLKESYQSGVYKQKENIGKAYMLWHFAVNELIENQHYDLFKVFDTDQSLEKILDKVLF